MRERKEQMRKIGYNSQRNNAAVKGLSGAVQCFATSAWMFLSYYAPNTYKADDDAGLARFVADVTKNGRSNEFEWSVQAATIQKYLAAAGVKKVVRLEIDLNKDTGLLSPDDLRAKLASGPVIIGTKKLGGLTGGHLILAVDNAPDGKVYHNDPYGDANTMYSDPNGESVLYTTEMYDKEHPGFIRAIYADDVA